MLAHLFFSQVIFLLIASTVLSSDENPVVETPLGKVRGFKQTSRSGKEYLAFTGLPYAKPPLGNLRFQPPSPVDPWPGVLNATEERGSTCMQFVRLYTSSIGNVMGTEDCLYLDVYTHNVKAQLVRDKKLTWPYKHEGSLDCKLLFTRFLDEQDRCTYLPYPRQVSRNAPVLVYFHGGGFIAGRRGYYLPDYLMDEDEIVVVNANYRLGILGFLSFENKEMPGNQGLKDQAMVLQWVQQNIASFGGDPNSVTITGCSAGGASVYHHIVSPMSRGLFHRAVASSGSSYNPWALSPPGLARNNARILMASIECPTDDVNAAISCAIKKDAKEIVNNYLRFLFLQYDPMLTFSPVLENPRPGAFLTIPVSSWNHSPVPLLIFLSSAEGLYRAVYLKDIIEEFSDNFNEIAPTTLHYWASAKNPDEVTKKIRDYYFQDKTKITLDNENLTHMYSDAYFNHGILEGANKHKGKVYFLYFDYVRAGSCPGRCIGANHCSDASFLWKIDMSELKMFFNFTVQEKEVMLSKELVKLVTNFSKTGIPKIPKSENAWKPWTKESNNYLHLEENGYTLKNGLLQDRFQFWDSLGYKNKFT